MARRSRLQEITSNQFKELLVAKCIVPASLDDVLGTHHNRPLYRHPNTGDYFVAVKGAAYFVNMEEVPYG